MNIHTDSPGAGYWYALDSDEYDGAPDAGHQIVGHGSTEAEAIDDFRRLRQERDDELAVEAAELNHIWWIDDFSPGADTPSLGLLVSDHYSRKCSSIGELQLRAVIAAQLALAQENAQ